MTVIISKIFNGVTHNVIVVEISSFNIPVHGQISAARTGALDNEA
jgi:hypothetical protein